MCNDLACHTLLSGTGFLKHTKRQTVNMTALIEMHPLIQPELQLKQQQSYIKILKKFRRRRRRRGPTALEQQNC